MSKSAGLCLLFCVGDPVVSAFRHFLQKEEPKFDLLHLAESLGEEHRPSDLAVCANFSSCGPTLPEGV